MYFCSNSFNFFVCVMQDTSPIGLRDSFTPGVSNSRENHNNLRKGKQKVTIAFPDNSSPSPMPALVPNKPIRKSNCRTKTSNLNTNDIPAFNLEMHNDPSTEEVRKMRGISTGICLVKLFFYKFGYIHVLNKLMIYAFLMFKRIY